MNTEAEEKKDKFRTQIRRKFIDDLFKQQREQLLQRELGQINANTKLEQPTLESLMTNIESASVKGLYNLISQFGSFTLAVPFELYDPIIALIMTPNSLASHEGLRLLSIAIQQCCCQAENKATRQTMLAILQKYKVVQQIYILTVQSLNQKNVKRTKLLLHCLKSLSLGRVSIVRSKPLLEQYLPPLANSVLEEPSMLILMSYISQEITFSVDITRTICKIAYAKEPICKLTACNILMNYCMLEENTQAIAINFIETLNALQHLYISTKEMKTRLNTKILKCIIELIQKYPSGNARQLLASIHHCKLHQLLSVMLKVSPIQLQIIVFQIETVVIQKALGELEQQFYGLFPQDMLDSIFLGMESSRLEIIMRSLKAVSKLVKFASPGYLADLQRKHELTFITQNLSYHQNEYISAAAESLFQTFQSIRKSDEMTVMRQ